MPAVHSLLYHAPEAFVWLRRGLTPQRVVQSVIGGEHGAAGRACRYVSGDVRRIGGGEGAIAPGGERRGGDARGAVHGGRRHCGSSCVYRARNRSRARERVILAAASEEPSARASSPNERP